MFRKIENDADRIGWDDEFGLAEENRVSDSGLFQESFVGDNLEAAPIEFEEILTSDSEEVELEQLSKITSEDEYSSREFQSETTDPENDSYEIVQVVAVDLPEIVLTRDDASTGSFDNLQTVGSVPAEFTPYHMSLMQDASDAVHETGCGCAACAEQQTPVLHEAGCGCAACLDQDSHQGHHHHGGVHSAYHPDYEMPIIHDHGSGAAEDFVLAGGRWINNGGFTTNLGGAAGTISWSIAGSGLLNSTGTAFFTGSSVTMSSFLNFDFEAQLQRAFDAWSAVANIDFVQVADGGGNFGVGNSPTIRIGGGFIDGQNGPSVLARAFFPSSAAAGGDIIFDSGDTNFFANQQNFFLTALHEIGHAIGLDHENINLAIMNPIINTSLTGLTADDIAGIQAVYGARAASPFTEGDDMVTLTTPGLISNALGGNDTVVGTDGMDTINGDGGMDSLTGGLGNDVIDGGADNDTVIATQADGDDIYTGGSGFDIIDFSQVQGVIQINQLGGVITGSAGNDTLNDVFEQVIGSNFDDVLSGGNGGDVLDGNDGNDQFFANGGDDLVRGGEGNDTFFFSTNDGNDRLEGGAGFDVLDYSSLQGVVQVNQLDGTTTGTANNDILLDVFEQVIGTDFGDVLSGGQGINVLNGGGGDDQLFANGGSDQVSGGAGNDTITMGFGDDRLDFRNGDEIDTITDFNAGAGSEDQIILTFHSAATSFAQMQSAGMFSQQGADTHIDLGNGDLIVLQNVMVGALHQDDFIF